MTLLSKEEGANGEGGGGRNEDSLYPKPPMTAVNTVESWLFFVQFFTANKLDYRLVRMRLFVAA